MFILYLLHNGTVHEFPLCAKDACTALREAYEEYTIEDKGWEFWKLEKK